MKQIKRLFGLAAKNVALRLEQEKLRAKLEFVEALTIIKENADASTNEEIRPHLERLAAAERELYRWLDDDAECETYEQMLQETVTVDEKWLRAQQDRRRRAGRPPRSQQAPSKVGKDVPATSDIEEREV
jgi:regulator of replication initiation timing